MPAQTITIFSLFAKMNFSVFHYTLLLFSLVVADRVFALEYLEFRLRGQLKNEEGRVVIPAEDGMVFEARDGVVYVLSNGDIISHKSDEIPFTPYTKKEIVERLKQEFPTAQGYNLLVNDHFLVVYTTSEGFARWYSSLLECLYEGYFRFWSKQGITLEEPTFPMVAIVLSNQPDLVRYAQRDGFTLFDKQVAYYSQFTNRVVICDLTGRQTVQEGERGRSTSRQRQAFLNQPGAAFNVATVVHEATHLVGYSSGQHRRFAPNPFWILEGLAVFHEVPDLEKREGWSITPRVNANRMRDLTQYLRSNPARPLQAIIESDAAFKQPGMAGDAYAMAWGLTYYLVKRRPKELAAYLELLQEKMPLTPDSPEIRIADFERCFGENWQKLYEDCGEYLLKLKF